MRDFIKDSFEAQHEDSRKDLEYWTTKEERMQIGVVHLILLVFFMFIAIVTPFSFTNIMLFLILVELTAIKDVLRKGLTKLR